LRRNDLAHSSDFIRCVARNANVVIALKYDLDVANVELRRIAELGQFASVANDVVDKVICELKNSLYKING
jgi:hypothetical protein